MPYVPRSELRRRQENREDFAVVELVFGTILAVPGMIGLWLIPAGNSIGAPITAVIVGAALIAHGYRQLT